jgi:hypothetical protein
MKNAQLSAWRFASGTAQVSVFQYQTRALVAKAASFTQRKAGLLTRNIFTALLNQLAPVNGFIAR